MREGGGEESYILGPSMGRHCFTSCRERIKGAILLPSFIHSAIGSRMLRLRQPDWMLKGEETVLPVVMRAC